MCYENRDAAYAAVCKERDNLKRELKMARAERDAVTKRMIELEQIKKEKSNG